MSLIRALRGLEVPQPGPFPNTILIPLTQGKHAIIDESDLALISKYSWYAHQKGGCWYAHAGFRVPSPGVIRMHTVISGKKFIDHENRNGLDNRRSNLRSATRSQNCANRKTPSVLKTSKYRGVYKSKWRGWVAQIKKDKKNIHIGTFGSEQCAAMAYDEHAVKLFGEFAMTNFPVESKCS